MLLTVYFIQFTSSHFTYKCQPKCDKMWSKSSHLAQPAQPGQRRDYCWTFILHYSRCTPALPHLYRVILGYDDTLVDIRRNNLTSNLLEKLIVLYFTFVLMEPQKLTLNVVTPTLVWMVSLYVLKLETFKILQLIGFILMVLGALHTVLVV